MATADSVKAKIQGLIASANAKTGNTDADLTTAVNALIAGFGQGGGGSSGGASGIYMAKVTPARDAEGLVITHNLGTTDILAAVCWAESLGDVTPAFDGAVANVYLKSSLPFRLTSSINHENMIAFARWSVSNANVVTIGQPTTDAYFSKVVDENTFEFARAGASVAKHFAGVTYTVIIIAASAFAEV